MNSRVSWSTEGIDPSVRERAEAAARRAGMSLNDWLNSTMGDSAPTGVRAGAAPRPQAPDVSDIHQRLDSITRQIERISQPAPASRSEQVRNEPVRSEPVRSEPGVARQLNDAISRLDARLSQISNPAPARQAQLKDTQRKSETVERAATQVYRPSPPLSPASLDFAIAEIAARQSELDNVAPRPALPRSAPPTAAAAPAAPAKPAAPNMSAAPNTSAAPNMPAAPVTAPGPDFSALERHLFKITSQIEALQRPDVTEQSIAAFRSELSEIRLAITEAMPRRAIESIESEIRSLSRRIDDTRSSGTDDKSLAGIERALGEIHGVLRTLTPAEQLAGYDEALRNLGSKLDMILRANDDPSTVHQLEGAIAALRSIVSNVASNDALARLSDDVRTLSSRVDQFGRNDAHGDSLAMLEQRIAALTSSLESREPPAASDNSEQIEGALRALSERLDRIPVGDDNATAFAHLEQRVSFLLERLEATTDHRAGNLSRVEDGLQDVLRHLEHQNANFAALAERASAAAPAMQDTGLADIVSRELSDIRSHLELQNTNFAALAERPQAAAPVMQDTGLADIVKRELSDIRFSQSATERHTQESLEAVHSTLGHVVDRLAIIEGDLQAVRAAPVAPRPEMAPPPVEAPRMAMPPQPESSFRPELPNPAAMQTELQPAATQAHFEAAPREFGAAEPIMPAPLSPPVPPRAISEILEPHAASSRATIEPDLPPDHPLEPGTRPGGRPATPSERIAASESAISGIPTAPPAPTSTSSFIAAARRAAQAAAAQPPEKVSRASSKPPANKDRSKEGSTITSKIRSLLVGASVVVIVLGTFKMAMTLLDSGSAPKMPALQSSSEPAPSAQPAATDEGTRPATPSTTDPVTAPALTAPSMTSPTPIGQQSFYKPAPSTPAGTASVEIPLATASAAAAAAASLITSNDVTGAIPSQTAPARTGGLSQVQVPPTERLPDAIGGPVLRTAALKGDPSAAYEIGVRFAEGKGVAANMDEAAKWYDRAAQAGVVPAVFRLGTLYEKGMGVKKDIEIARRYYMQSAERGNAKAMHNLAVLEADGGGKGANYKNASGWFRKAADRGVADSQFNLGILYARGIGVEQNLAESFKWFSLAAAQGDADAGRKRDDIAKRLDAQSLAAAKLAIQTFTPEPQPDEAIKVATPEGGWDSAPVQAVTTKPAAKPATKRAAATH